MVQFVGWCGWVGMVSAVGVLDGAGGAPGQVLGQGQVGLGVAARLVAGQGDGAKDAGPAHQRHHHPRPDVERGEQLQVVGVPGDPVEAGPSELVQQQRLAGPVGFGGRVGAG